MSGERRLRLHGHQAAQLFTDLTVIDCDAYESSVEWMFTGGLVLTFVLDRSGPDQERGHFELGVVGGPADG